MISIESKYSEANYMNEDCVKMVITFDDNVSWNYSLFLVISTFSFRIHFKFIYGIEIENYKLVIMLESKPICRKSSSEWNSKWSNSCVSFRLSIHFIRFEIELMAQCWPNWMKTSRMFRTIETIKKIYRGNLSAPIIQWMWPLIRKHLTAFD